MYGMEVLTCRVDVDGLPSQCFRDTWWSYERRTRKWTCTLSVYGTLTYYRYGSGAMAQVCRLFVGSSIT
jgi:hypothetical protein